MCIRDSAQCELALRPHGVRDEEVAEPHRVRASANVVQIQICLLYTSDAADERSSDLV